MVRTIIMLFALASVMIAGFAPPPNSLLVRPATAPPLVRMQNEVSGWSPPKDLGPLGNLDRLFPTDVQLTDVDGDDIVLRGKGGATVEYYVGRKGRMRAARLKISGNSLQISGQIKKPVPLFSLIGFNLEEFVTDVCTPQDPADLDKAMALVGQGPSREIV